MSEEFREALSQNTQERDVELATRIRQCFRAVEAGDELAVQDEIPLIIRRLYTLLDYLLESDPSWDSSGLWFDDMIRTRYELVRPDRVRVSGELVWGLHSDPGPQWSAPFFADVVISGDRRDTASYHLRFGRRDETVPSELTFGLYPSHRETGDSLPDPWGGRADWKYEFRKGMEADPGSGPA